MSFSASFAHNDESARARALLPPFKIHGTPLLVEFRVKYLNQIQTTRFQPNMHQHHPSINIPTTDAVFSLFGFGPDFILLDQSTTVVGISSSPSASSRLPPQSPQVVSSPSPTTPNGRVQMDVYHSRRVRRLSVSTVPEAPAAVHVARDTVEPDAIVESESALKRFKKGHSNNSSQEFAMVYDNAGAPSYSVATPQMRTPQYSDEMHTPTTTGNISAAALTPTAATQPATPLVAAANVRRSSSSSISVHDNDAEEETRCPECQEVYESKSSLQRHIKTVHDKIKRYICSRCGTSHTQFSNCRNHMRNSSTCKDNHNNHIICPGCPFRCTSLENLDEHNCVQDWILVMANGNQVYRGVPKSAGPSPSPTLAASASSVLPSPSSGSPGGVATTPSNRKMIISYHSSSQSMTRSTSNSALPHGPSMSRRDTGDSDWSMLDYSELETSSAVSHTSSRSSLSNLNFDTLQCSSATPVTTFPTPSPPPSANPGSGVRRAGVIATTQSQTTFQIQPVISNLSFPAVSNSSSSFQSNVAVHQPMQVDSIPPPLLSPNFVTPYTAVTTATPSVFGQSSTQQLHAQWPPTAPCPSPSPRLSPERLPVLSPNRHRASMSPTSVSPISGPNHPPFSLAELSSRNDDF